MSDFGRRKGLDMQYSSLQSSTSLFASKDIAKPRSVDGFVREAFRLFGLDAVGGWGGVLDTLNFRTKKSVQRKL